MLNHLVPRPTGVSGLLQPLYLPNGVSGLLPPLYLPNGEAGARLERIITSIIARTATTKDIARIATTRDIARIATTKEIARTEMTRSIAVKSALVANIRPSNITSDSSFAGVPS